MYSPSRDQAQGRVAALKIGFRFTESRRNWSAPSRADRAPVAGELRGRPNGRLCREAERLAQVRQAAAKANKLGGVTAEEAGRVIAPLAPVTELRRYAPLADGRTVRRAERARCSHAFPRGGNEGHEWQNAGRFRPKRSRSRRREP